MPGVSCQGRSCSTLGPQGRGVTAGKCRASLRNGCGYKGGAKTDLRARYSDSGVPIPECRSASGRSAPRYRISVFVKYGFVVVVSNQVV
jgi:hypothetical protein